MIPVLWALYIEKHKSEIIEISWNFVDKLNFRYRIKVETWCKAFISVSYRKTPKWCDSNSYISAV